MGAEKQMQWRVIEDETIWQTHQAVPSSINTQRGSQLSLRLLLEFAIPALILLGIIAWFSRPAREDVATAQSKMEESVKGTLAPSAEMELSFEPILYTNGMAEISVVIMEEGVPLAYRQVHLFRRDLDGWHLSRDEVVDHGLQPGGRFFLEASNRDLALFDGIAERVIDYGHARMSTLLPAALSAERPLTIRIEGSAAPSWNSEHSMLRVPSPALQKIPAAYSEQDVLYQSILLGLNERLYQELLREVGELPPEWLPLGLGLRLNLLASGGGIVQAEVERLRALYTDMVRIGLNEKDELCQLFGLWDLDTTGYGIPLICDTDGRARLFVEPFPASLSELGLPRPMYDNTEGFVPLYTVPFGRFLSLQMLLGYSIETYGEESVLRLFEALDEHDSWETLIPAVYGVDAARFEMEWLQRMEELTGG